MSPVRFSFIVLLLLLGSPSNAQTVEWIRQLGTSEDDASRSVSADVMGNAYISGYTRGLLGSSGNGFFDPFLSKYNANGNLVWTQQLGTISWDESHGVSADAAGNVYISGWTYENLDGINEGDADAFVSKYDGEGAVLWTRQLGSFFGDESYDVSIDEMGNAYITGYTQGDINANNQTFTFDDAFISKYDTNGNHEWTQQFGTSQFERSKGVSTDGRGNIYVSGTTSGPLGGAYLGGFSDAFVRKYDEEGNHMWTQQLGTTSSDEGYSVSVDKLGNVFVSGSTEGNLNGTNAGGTDAFVSKYDSDGNHAWTRQLGTFFDDNSYGVAVDGRGNVFITGFTDDDLEGTNAGFSDAFVSKLEANGDTAWTRQLGSEDSDIAYGVSTDGRGSVFISGRTHGDLAGPSAGGDDAFLIKLIDETFVQGDYNSNGIVDAADYTVWRDTFGQTGMLLAADGNGDNVVDAADHSYWGTRFGNTVGGVTSDSVPEPNTLVTMLAALGMLKTSRRTGRG